MDFDDHIGGRCALKSCNLHDYLIYRCDACGLGFCHEHRTYDGHACGPGRYKLEKQRAVECPVGRFDLSL